MAEENLQTTDTTTTTPDTTTKPDTPAQPWHKSADDLELLGYIENRGWDKLTPAEAAIAAAKAHREVSKMVGVPPEQVLKLPAKPDDAEGWKAVHRRLGAPDTVEGYEFPDVTFSDPALAEGFKKALAESALESGVSKVAASRIASKLAAFIGQQDVTKNAEQAALLEADRQALKVDWGPHLEDNLFISRQAVKAFGVDDTVIDAMQAQLGYHKTMNFFLEVGKKIGEDKYIIGSRQGMTVSGQLVTTKEGAIARKAELMKDNAWQQRLFAGGQTEKNELAHLTQLIVGE